LYVLPGHKPSQLIEWTPIDQLHVHAWLINQQSKCLPYNIQYVTRSTKTDHLVKNVH